MKKVLMSLALGCAMAVGSAQASTQKIGVVDMQAAIQGSERGKKAKSDLESEVNKKRAELKKEEEDLKKATEDFQKQSLALNEKARTARQTELQQRFMKLQEKSGMYTQELQQKERDLTAPIVQKLKGIIQNIAKQKGYTMVIEKNETTVLFSQDSDDLTTEVVKAFNSDKG